MTLHLDGVHICHILKYRLRRLYQYSLSAKNWDENYLEGICMVKVEPYSIHGSFLKLEYLITEFN